MENTFEVKTMSQFLTDLNRRIFETERQGFPKVVAEMKATRTWAEALLEQYKRIKT